MSWLLDPFQSDFSQRAGLVCVMVGILAPVVGTWVSLRRLAYLGDSMSHSVLGGVALGFAWFGSAAVLPGALVAGIVMALIINWLSQNRRVAADSVIAVVGSAMFALGILGLSEIDSNASISHYLFGQLLTVSTTDMWVTLVLSVAGVAWVWWRFEDLKLSTFDRDHAMQVGVRIQRLDASMLILLAACVVVCLNTVGIALTVSLLITPSATARLLADKTSVMTGSAVAIGLSYVVTGFIVAYHADLAPGPVITVLGTAVFVACYAVRNRGAERAHVHSARHHDGHNR